MFKQIFGYKGADCLLEDAGFLVVDLVRFTGRVVAVRSQGLKADFRYEPNSVIRCGIVFCDD